MDLTENVRRMTAPSMFLICFAIWSLRSRAKEGREGKGSEVRR